MKFGKFSLGAIVGCMAFVSSASANVAAIVNICEVKPDGSVHTVRVSTLGTHNAAATVAAAERVRSVPLFTLKTVGG